MDDSTAQPLRERDFPVAARGARSPSPTLLALLVLPLLGIFAALMMLVLESRSPSSVQVDFVPAPPRSVLAFPAPDFELPMLDGLSLVSPEDFLGKPLFLNFWASWCQPCVRELPALAEFAADQAQLAGGAALLTINLGEGADAIRAFLAQLALDGLPIAMDINEVVKRDYGVQNLPTTFVIDSAGRVQHMKLGEVTIEELYIYMEDLAVRAAE